MVGSVTIYGRYYRLVVLILQRSLQICKSVIIESVNDLRRHTWTPSLYV